jgi:dihydrofolate reductase
MGKLVVSEFVSLDGVFGDPGGGEGSGYGGWTFSFERGDDGDRFKFDELMASDAQLLGRITYEGFAANWPTMEGAGEFGEKMNQMPKYVVSTTLKDPTWANTTVIRDDVIKEVTGLKSRHAGDVLVSGSGQLVRALMRHGVVDEFRLMTFPIVLGSGKRLFEDATTTALTLAEVRPVGSDGVTVSVYRPRDGRGGNAS